MSLVSGQHDSDSIRRWVLGRLDYFDRTESDVRSTTTDSGDSVRKAMRELEVPWLPCFLLSLRNSVHIALGAQVNNDGEHCDGLSSSEVNTGSPAAKAVLGRIRKLLALSTTRT